MAIWKQLPMAHTAMSAAFYSLHTAAGNIAMNKFGSCIQWRNEILNPECFFLRRQWHYERSAILATSNERSAMLPTVATLAICFQIANICTRW
jgi:hypothetical protein